MDDANFQWLLTHGRQIQDRYAGTWIAVAGGEVAGSGATASQAYHAAKTRHPADEPLLSFVEEETNCIYALL